MSEKAPRARKGVRRQKDVDASELALVQQATTWVVDAYRSDPAQARELGVTDAHVRHLERATKTIDSTIRLPRMKAVALAALRGGITAEEAKTGYFLAIRALHAMAPWILMKAAEKMDDHQAPGSTRVILELLKGIGIYQPAEPISAKKRMDQLDSEIVEGISDSDLKNEILDLS